MPTDKMATSSFSSLFSLDSMRGSLPNVVSSTYRMTLTFLLTLSLPLGSRMYPHGPPHQACDSMLPNHRAAPQDTSTSPYNLVVEEATTYSPGQRIKVSIQGTPFVGFMLQVRRAAPGNVVTLPIGTFCEPPPYSRYLDCTEKNDTITHANNGPKWNMEFTWKPPDRPYGPVRFIATLVFRKDTYWLNVTSRVLQPRNYRVRTTSTLRPTRPTFTFKPLPTLPELPPYLTSTVTSIIKSSTSDYEKEWSIATVSVVTKLTSRVEAMTTSSHMIVEQDHFPLIGGSTATQPLLHLVLATASILSIATLRVL